MLSWVPIDPYHPIVIAVRRIADLLCDPIRRLVPMHSLGIDLSPFIAILLLQFTNQFVVASLRELGAADGVSDGRPARLDVRVTPGREAERLGRARCRTAGGR